MVGCLNTCQKLNDIVLLKINEIENGQIKKFPVLKFYFLFWFKKGDVWLQVNCLITFEDANNENRLTFFRQAGTK